MAILVFTLPPSANSMKGELRMAARRSRTRPACAKGPLARYILLIFVIPTATNCAGSTVRQTEAS